jgi:hypothetical protein
MASNGKAISVTGHGFSYSYAMSGIPHFLDNRFRDGSVIVSLTFRPLSTLQEHFVVLISVRS